MPRAEAGRLASSRASRDDAIGQGAQASDDYRPLVFIGSSSEGLALAENLKSILEDDCEVELWSDGVFGVGDITLLRLLSLARRVDFAVLCLTADDVKAKRGRRMHSPRDNVIFEAGLFMGRLGRARTLLVYSKEPELDLPTDLLGLTTATYPAGEPERSVPVAAKKIRAAIAHFRPREVYDSSSAHSRDFDVEWIGGARGAFQVRHEEDDTLLSIKRRSSEGEVNLWLTIYRDGRARLRVLRPEPLETGRRELSVALDVRSDTDCTFLIQLKAEGAAPGQYVGQSRLRLHAGDWEHMRKSFVITTTADFRVRLRQRSVEGNPSTLDIRRLTVVESVLRD